MRRTRGSPSLRGLCRRAGVSSGCTQQWHTRVGSSSSASGFDVVNGEPPDNFGGVIVSVTNTLTSGNGWPSTSSVIPGRWRSDGPTWCYHSPGNFANNIAVDQNGYVLVTENYSVNQHQEYSVSRLIKIEPNTGVPVANWGPWPASTITTVPGCELSAGSTTLALGVGPYLSRPRWNLLSDDQLVEHRSFGRCRRLIQGFTATT